MKWNGFKKKLFKVLFYKWYVYVVELDILMIISVWSFINFIIVFINMKKDSNCCF